MKVEYNLHLILKFNLQKKNENIHHITQKRTK